MVQGESAQFTATVLDEDGNPIIGRTFVWYSRDSSVAYVSQQGLVTVKQPGSCQIFATAKPVVGSTEVFISDASITDHLLMSGRLAAMAVFGNKGYIANLDTPSIIKLDVSGRSSAGTIATGAFANSIVFSPDGSRAYFTSDDKLGAIDARADTLIGMVTIATLLASPVTSADGATIWVTSGFYGYLYAVSAATLSVFDSVRVPDLTDRVVYHSGLNRLYLDGRGDATIREYDATTLALLRSWGVGGWPNGMAFSLDGARLFVANGQRWIDEIVLGSGTLSARVTLPVGVNIVVPAPGGSRLAVTGASDFVFLLSAFNRSVVKTVYTGGGATGVAYTPDGSRMVVSNINSWVDYIR